MVELSPLREAHLEFAIADLSVDIEAHDAPNPRTEEQQSLVHKFNLDGKGGAWCADIIGYRLAEIARQASEADSSVKPLLDHEKVLSTMDLTLEADAVGALFRIGAESLPQPADIITFGYVEDEFIGRPDTSEDVYTAIGKMEKVDTLNDFKGGQHTATVLESWVIQDEESIDYGWIAVVTIDGGITQDPDGDGVFNKVSVSPSIYLIHPETMETQIYYDLNSYPEYPDEGLTGKVAAMGYIDIESLPGALETNLALEKRGGFDSPNYSKDGPGYLETRNAAIAQISPNILLNYPKSAEAVLGPALETLTR